MVVDFLVEKWENLCSNMNKQQAKEKIKGLIAEYDDLKSKNNLKEPRFNEAFAKQRFIQPFFEALGWNFKIDVWPEEKVSKGKVDYSFRIDNFIKFFVEAKKFSEDLEKEEWTKQIIDYSYNKGVTWGVLTNFEKIKLFNSEWNVRPYKPVK